MKPPDDVRRGTAYDLHVLVARLDRNADRILRAELDLSYPRFLLLLTLRRTGALTQRALAEELGITEPTVSRTVTSLADAGLTAVTSTPGQGNRRAVSLTDEGAALVEKGAARLEDAFRSLLAGAGVDHTTLHDVTRRLLDTLGTHVTHSGGAS
jgi:DNA-binding MarR family transcriptional regulator